LFLILPSHNMFRPILPSSGAFSLIGGTAAPFCVMCLSFSVYAVCRCYECSVELVPVLHVYMGLGCVCCYLVFTSRNVSNIGLCVSMYVSFMCSLFLLILYMLYFSNVFKHFPFFSILWCPLYQVQSHTCVPCLKWFEYLTLPLLFPITYLYMFFISSVKCSTCLSYVFLWESRHFIWWPNRLKHVQWKY
jgi:hypothetical protein